MPLPGWYSSEQERPIGDQLHDGVRGLLIDTHYADRLPNGKVRTYFGSFEQLRKQAQRDGVSDDAVAAALRIRDRLGFEGEGERGMYLCHSFCELGPHRLKTVLEDMRTFLVANPGAVVVVINQDYVTPEDFVGAVKDAGVAEFAYTGPVTGRWQTLREMVASGKRVGLPGGEQGRRSAVVPPGVRRHHGGDAVRVQTGGAAHEPRQARGELRAEPRVGGTHPYSC